MQSTLYVLFGFLFLYIVNLSIIGMIFFVFLKIQKDNKKLEGKVLSTTSLLALAVLIINSIALILFSNKYAFIFVSFLFLAGVNLLILYRYRKLDIYNSLILASIIAVFVNPFWLDLLGVL